MNGALGCSKKKLTVLCTSALTWLNLLESWRSVGKCRSLILIEIFIVWLVNRLIWSRWCFGALWLLWWLLLERVFRLTESCRWLLWIAALTVRSRPRCLLLLVLLLWRVSITIMNIIVSGLMWRQIISIIGLLLLLLLLLRRLMMSIWTVFVIIIVIMQHVLLMMARGLVQIVDSVRRCMNGTRCRPSVWRCAEWQWKVQ